MLGPHANVSCCAELAAKTCSTSATLTATKRASNTSAQAGGSFAERHMQSCGSHRQEGARWRRSLSKLVQAKAGEELGESRHCLSWRPGQLHEAKGCHLRIQAQAASHFGSTPQIRVACPLGWRCRPAAFCCCGLLCRCLEERRAALLAFTDSQKQVFFPRLAGASPAVVGLRGADLGDLGSG